MVCVYVHELVLMHVQVRVCMCIYNIHLYIDVRFDLIICTKTKPQVYKLFAP